MIEESIQKPIIREGKPEDYQGWCEILVEAHLLHLESLPHIFRLPDDPIQTEEDFRRLLNDAENALFVAEFEEQVVGFLHLGIRQSQESPFTRSRRYGVIHSLAVKQGYRRQGIGRRLVQRGHGWMKEQGLDEVELNVWAFNDGAIRFYRELGYFDVSHLMRRSLGYSGS